MDRPLLRLRSEQSIAEMSGWTGRSALGSIPGSVPKLRWYQFWHLIIWIIFFWEKINCGSIKLLNNYSSLLKGWLWQEAIHEDWIRSRTIIMCKLYFVSLLCSLDSYSTIGKTLVLFLFYLGTVMLWLWSLIRFKFYFRSLIMSGFSSAKEYVCEYW